MKEKWMPHIIAVTALVVFIVLGLACGTTEKAVKGTADTHFERGNEFVKQERWESAFDEYTKAIELNPDFAAAYSERARVRTHISDSRNTWKSAEADCNKAIELDPQKPAPYYYRRGIYSHWGNVEAYTNAFGYSTNSVATSDITQLTKAIKYYNDALSDFNKGLALSPNNQMLLTAITEAKTKKGACESALASANSQRRITEETNRYDPSRFTVVPSDFKPADYTLIDLFKAVSNSRNLQRASSKEEAFLGQLQSAFMSGLGGVYYLEYKSDLSFVRQNGTDITFSSDDNAITQNMTIDQRSGLQPGQKVRVYYMITRSPLITWDVIAIERR